MQENQNNLVVDIDSPPTSQLYTESEEEVPYVLIPLKDIDDRTSFLQSVSFVFLIYSIVFFSVNIFLLLDMRMAK